MVGLQLRARGAAAAWVAATLDFVGVASAAEAPHAEARAPALLGVLTASYTRGRLDVLLRTRYHGEYENTLNATLATTQGFGAKVLVDLGSELAPGQCHASDAARASSGSASTSAPSG